MNVNFNYIKKILSIFSSQLKKMWINKENYFDQVSHLLNTPITASAH